MSLEVTFVEVKNTSVITPMLSLISIQSPFLIFPPKMMVKPLMAMAIVINPEIRGKSMVASTQTVIMAMEVVPAEQEVEVGV